MKSATLDTNLLLEYWKRQDKQPVVENLLSLAETDTLDLAVTGRIRDDVPRPPLADRIDRLHELRVDETGAVFRLDVSALDGPDMLGDDHFMDVSSELMRRFHEQGKLAPDDRDWDHLHAHYLLGRDAFLTWDRRILEIADDLKERLGLIVMKPEDFLRNLNDETA